MYRVRTFLLAVQIFAGLIPAGVCLAKEGAVTPEILLGRARTLQLLWANGTPPAQMRVEFEYIGAKSKTIMGNYSVDWISSSQWSERLEIGNYRRVRLHTSTGYWQNSTFNYQPLVAFQLDSILDFKTVFKIWPYQSFGKIKSHNKSGTSQACVEIKSRTGIERNLCFDESTGNLLSMEYPTGENQSQPEISRVEYGVFTDFAGKRIPFEIRAFRDRTLILTARISELDRLPEQNAVQAEIPHNSTFWPQCDDMQDPVLLSHGLPAYPADARSAGEKGRVIFYAVVKDDGSLSQLTLIQGATPRLDSAAADAVRQRRYKPAACGSTPIPMEIAVVTDFWLSHSNT